MLSSFGSSRKEHKKDMVLVGALLLFSIVTPILSVRVFAQGGVMPHDNVAETPVGPLQMAGDPTVLKLNELSNVVSGGKFAATGRLTFENGTGIDGKTIFFFEARTDLPAATTGGIIFRNDANPSNSIRI